MHYQIEAAGFVEYFESGHSNHKNSLPEQKANFTG